MGNCLNLLSSEDDNDPLLSPMSSPFHPDCPPPPPSCVIPTMQRLPSATHTAIPSKRRPARFVPILPFFTPSDLVALYELGPELGRGQFGIIHKCANRVSGAQFACKSISKRRLRTIHNIRDVIREINIMQRLSNHIPPQGCPAPASCNVVCLHEVIEDSTHVHLIMELCNGGELFDRIVRKKCYTEAQAAILIKSLLETLQFCHSMGIMHRDLKPENLLFVDELEESALKLADFGLAVEFSPGQKFSTMAGSAYYIAPEVLEGEYSKEIDMWSVGVIMYVLLSGVPPFWGHTEEGIFHAIQEGRLDLTCAPWQTISSTAKDLITRMLCVDAKLRWTPAQAIEHPWIVLHASIPLPPQIIDRSQDMIVSRDLDMLSDRPVLLLCEILTPEEHANVQTPIILSHDTPTLDDEHANGKSVGSLTSAMLAYLCDLAGLQPEESDGMQSGLNQLVVSLVAALDEERVSFSESLSKVRLRVGWSCMLLTTSATEETLMVDMGQEKYLFAHDRLRKQLGWKVLKPQCFPWLHGKSTPGRAFQQLQRAC